MTRLRAQAGAAAPAPRGPRGERRGYRTILLRYLSDPLTYADGSTWAEVPEGDSVAVLLSTLYADGEPADVSDALLLDELWAVDLTAEFEDEDSESFTVANPDAQRGALARTREGVLPASFALAQAAEAPSSPSRTAPSDPNFYFDSPPHDCSGVPQSLHVPGSSLSGPFGPWVAHGYRGGCVGVDVPYGTVRSGQVWLVAESLDEGIAEMYGVVTARSYSVGGRVAVDTEGLLEFVVTQATPVQIVSAGRKKASTLQIARWDEAYDPNYEVKNGADTTANFVDLDPERFYVRVTDSAANLDVEAPDEVRVRLGTSSPEGNDEPTDLILTETGKDTGVFESASQILVTRDFPIPNEGSTPLRYTDDHFPVHDGRSGPVADEETNDRTHWAGVGGSVTATYSSGEAEASASAPVCGDQARTLSYRVASVLEPYSDVGYLHPGTGERVGAGDGEFSYYGMDTGEPHRPGIVSEPYLDMSDAYVNRSDLNAQVASTASLDGYLPGEERFANSPPEMARGPIAPPWAVEQLVSRADLLWEQGCIRFEEAEPVIYIDRPITSASMDIHGDLLFDGLEDTWYLFQALKPLTCSL